MPARWKYFLQSVAGLGAAIILYFTAVFPAETQLFIPFFKNVALDMGWFYIVFSYFVIVGSSNAVNLTDGLDGLAIMPTVMIAAALRSEERRVGKGGRGRSAPGRGRET